MKKSLVTILALGLTVVSVFAQGAIKFANIGSGANGSTVNARFYNTDGVTALSGTGFSVQLYAGTLGTAEGSLTAMGPVVNFLTGASAGYMSSFPSVTIAGVAAGSQATIQFRAWNNQGGTVNTWEAASIRGASAVLTSPNLGDPLNPSTLPVATGLASFSLVPEPSTYALGALGVSALLFMRRRK